MLPLRILLANYMILAVAALPSVPIPVSLTSYYYGGTGCPLETLIASMRPYPINASTYAIDISFGGSWNVSIGPSVPRNQTYKTCYLSLNITHPADYQFCIPMADFNGRANIDANITARQRNTYYNSASFQVS